VIAAHIAERLKHEGHEGHEDAKDTKEEQLSILAEASFVDAREIGRVRGSRGSIFLHALRVEGFGSRVPEQQP
jgi:hypothetical protein